MLDLADEIPLGAMQAISNTLTEHFARATNTLLPMISPNEGSAQKKMADSASS